MEGLAGWYEEENRPMSFGLLVRVFCYYPCFFTYTNHLTGSNGILKLWRYLQEATTKRTGPNDVKHVVWAISTCFFFLIVFFFFFFKKSFLSTRSIGATVLQMDAQEATTRKTSPNDMNCVVWAISFLY